MTNQVSWALLDVAALALLAVGLVWFTRRMRSGGFLRAIAAAFAAVLVLAAALYLLFLGMWLIAGTAPPRAVLPSGLRDFGEILPLTHIVIAIQDAWFGFGWATTDLAIIAAITVAAAIPAIWFFRWD